MSLSACKQVRHYITRWMTALGDTLVFGCTLVEIVQLTHTDKYYPSPVHWIAFCYMVSQKKKEEKKSLVFCTTLPDFHESEEAAALTCCWLTCHCPALIKACSSLSVLFLTYRLLIWRVHLQWPHLKSLIRTLGYKKANVPHYTALYILRAVKTSTKSIITGI